MGKKHIIYGVMENDIGDSSVFTLGGLYQKSREVPDFAGVILPCQNQKVAAFSSNPACNSPVTLPRSTRLGADWSRMKADKYNVFSSFKHIFDNGWELKAEASCTRSKTDAKVGQFFIKNEHTAGLSGAPAEGFPTEKGGVIPFEPKDKALEKLKQYRDQITQNYEAGKADYLRNKFDNTAFQKYRAERLAARQADYEECLNGPLPYFCCLSNISEADDKDEYIEKALRAQGIVDDGAARFPNRLYDSSYNRRNTYNRRYNFMPMRYNTKDDAQWGFKLDLSGQ